MEKKATRDSYGEALVMLAEKRPDLVVLDADLAAATKTGTFKKAYPDRFFDCGIAEANMMGVAAGIASTGKLVFASSFAMFAAGRKNSRTRITAPAETAGWASRCSGKIRTVARQRG